MNLKIKILIISLLLPLQVFAFTSLSPNLFTPWYIKLGQRVIECTWHIPCYFQKKLGAFTQVNSTDKQVNFPTTYNNNLNITMEVGTTSVASITTLPGLTSASALATIGTITTGVWSGTAITVSKGGTGSTTMGLNQVLLGNGTNAITNVPGLGTSGQFLTSNGVSLPPTWTTSAIDQSINYTWTGNHTWNTASSTFGFLLNAPNIAIGSSTIATTTIKNCQGCISGIETITAQSAGLASSAAYIKLQVTAKCSAGKIVIAGGGTIDQTTDNQDTYLYWSAPATTTQGWTAGITCGANSNNCGSRTVTAYAICVKN